MLSVREDEEERTLPVWDVSANCLKISKITRAFHKKVLAALTTCAMQKQDYRAPHGKPMNATCDDRWTFKVYQLYYEWF